MVCESKYDHRNRLKKLNFDKNFFSESKIKYFVLDEPFPENTNIWQNQAIQREYMLTKLDFVDAENKMFFREVDIFRLEEERVLISGGLLPGERICISPIQAVVDGMAVQPVIEVI